MPKAKENQRFFSGVVGGDLGIKRTSRGLLGDVDPSQPLGQAGIQTTFNASNGNLFVQDHTIPIESRGFR